jgi:hypothetical protein
MDFSRPLGVVSPTLDGDVLTVLAAADEEFSGRRIQRLLGHSSEPGVRKAAERLVEQGVVLRRPAGRAKLYRLNRQHLAGLDSDLDVFLIRRAGVESDSEAWVEQLAALERDASGWTGNDTRIVELGEAEVVRGDLDGVLGDALAGGTDLFGSRRRFRGSVEGRR